MAVAYGLSAMARRSHTRVKVLGLHKCCLSYSMDTDPQNNEYRSHRVEKYTRCPSLEWCEGGFDQRDLVDGLVDM